MINAFFFSLMRTTHCMVTDNVVVCDVAEEPPGVAVMVTV